MLSEEFIRKRIHLLRNRKKIYDVGYYTGGQYNIYKLKVGDIIFACGTCTCDMKGHINEVIFVDDTVTPMEYSVKILHNEHPTSHHEVNEIWKLDYMKGGVHSNCEVWRMEKVKNWRKRLEQ